MYCGQRRIRNIFVKNLKINSSVPLDFSKNLGHKSVSFLKKELNFVLDGLIINFVSSEEIISINLKYLRHNYPTDIITFDYSETNSGIDGEIYISYAQAGQNSKKYRCSTKKEVIRLITHGILHLCGYDDQEKVKKQIMKKIEDKLVEKQTDIWS